MDEALAEKKTNSMFNLPAIGIIMIHHSILEI